MQVLDGVGIESGYKNLIKYIHDGAKKELSINKERRSVKINRGTMQGDALSGKLFVGVLEEAFNKLKQ